MAESQRHGTPLSRVPDRSSSEGLLLSDPSPSRWPLSLPPRDRPASSLPSSAGVSTFFHTASVWNIAKEAQAPTRRRISLVRTASARQMAIDAGKANRCMMEGMPVNMHTPAQCPSGRGSHGLIPSSSSSPPWVPPPRPAPPPQRTEAP